jgi:hypothetical protein
MNVPKPLNGKRRNMSDQTITKDDEAQDTGGFSIRWRLILGVLVTWCAYIAIAFMVAPDMGQIWGFVAVLGALTSALLATMPTILGDNTKAGRFIGARKSDIKFLTIAFSLATIQAALFAFYFT